VIEIRGATGEDYDAYARLMPELAVDEQPAPRDRFGAELAARTIVAVEDGVVIGYALFEILADVGYVRNIVSDPARRRSGIGDALMAGLRARFSAAGATGWCLNVKPANAAAVGLYTRSGMARVYGTSIMRIRREIALPPAPADLELVPVVAVDDAAIETRFRLLAGQLASARSKVSRQVVALRRGDAVLGVAVFAATIPGAFPFRVVDPAFGAALLARVRALAPADSTYVQVGVEDDDSLRDALIALGAEVHLDIIHMRGQLRLPSSGSR
jgi:ribosomal protein S18 acetylase RimI-like enzyme